MKWNVSLILSVRLHTNNSRSSAKYWETLLCTALRTCEVCANSFLCAEGEWMRQFRNVQKMSATQQTRFAMKTEFTEHLQNVTINNHDSLTQVKVKVKVTLRMTVSESVCLGVGPRLGLMTECFFLFESYCPLYAGRPLWREVESVICQSWLVVLVHCHLYNYLQFYC
jgi:hypothetical protein